MTPEPSPSPAATAADRAYTATKEAILDGNAAPGQMLSEGEVAENVGVSRTPVREAFLRLQAEGWLRLYPKRGALVVPPDANEARDVVRSRLLIETHGAEAASTDPAVTERLVTTLKSAIAEQERAHADEDLAAYTRADLVFHREIVAAADNALLLSFQDQLAERTQRMSTRSLWRKPESTSLAISQHRDLVGAITAGDVTRFTTLLREHLTSVHREQLPD